MSSVVKRELEKAPEIPIIRKKWKPNILWRLFILVIYGGIKIPMANEQDSSVKPPIVQWPVFLFIASLALFAFSRLDNNSKDTASSAATTATIIEKLNSIETSIKTNKDFTDYKINQMEVEIKDLKQAQIEVEGLVGLRPSSVNQRQLQQLNESRKEQNNGTP